MAGTRNPKKNAEIILDGIKMVSQCGPVLEFFFNDGARISVAYANPRRAKTEYFQNVFSEESSFYVEDAREIVYSTWR